MIPIIKLPAKTEVAITVPVFTLRNTKAITLPEGLREVGKSWFAISPVEQVLIPASVVKIDSYAFADA